MSDYLVVRLTPSSPVDGATFATYLQGLTIDVYPANTPQSAATLLGSASYSSPLILIQILDGSFLVSASIPTLVATARTNFGKVLHFASTEGIPVGSYAFIFDPKGKNFLADGTTVTDITDKTVTLSKDIPDFLPADTIVTFILDYNLSNNPWADNALSFTAKTSAIAHKTKTVLPLDSATGIFFGMSVTTAFPGVIADGTTVVAADKTSVTLSQPLKQDIAIGTKINFTHSLNTGIIQHSRDAGFSIGGFDFYYPAAVATAIIPLNAKPPSFFDIAVKATRGTDMNGAELVILEDTYYNIQAISAPLPTTPDQYQFIPAQDTNFYVSLPAPPTNTNAIALTMPSDGTPPPFAALYNAVTASLKADPTIPPPGKPASDITALTPDECSQIAYDIVWSQQNLLPAPPDPLEDLYTNPPNSGASKGDSGNDEQDRQKFEGDLKSFYATRNSEAQRLATFVSALSLALSFEKRSQAATSVRFQFPIIDDNTTLTTIREAAVLLVDQGNQINLDFTNPGFAVPAEYFYALVLGLPPQSPSQAPQNQQQQMSQAQQNQYHLTCLMNEQQVLDKLNSAISKGIISAPPPAPVNPDDPNTPKITVTQAARNLAALGEVEYNDPQCSLNDYKDIQTLVQAWLNVTDDDTAIDTFWQGAVTTYPGGYLDLVLCLVTNNSTASINNSTALIKAIKAPLGTPTGGLNISSVAQLAQPKIQDWETFFGNHPDLLPDFTAPGQIKTKPTDPKVIKSQADVFVRNLQNFFQISAGSNQIPSVNPNVPPLLYRENPSYDPIVEFITAYPGFAFVATLDPTLPAFQTALDAVFSNDPAASKWLEQTIMAINAVWVLTTGITQAPEPNPTFLPDLRFSVMEALYARGFVNGPSVLNLSLDDFQQALTGTVAYSFASQIQTNASALPQSTSQSGSSQDRGFQPINSDGCLVNCIPPLYLSPFGPLAYLQEMLKVSDASTCENPQAGNIESSLDAKIARRRGNLGWLQVTAANLETPLPRIDLVNECLEALVATPGSPPPVYTTASEKLDGYTLCADDTDSDHPAVCHKPATLLEALPQNSSPSTLVVKATAYDTLRSDFSSPLLPYAQSLDISRSYLRHMETSRYDVMRRFRQKIIEFVLAPEAEPGDFQNSLWRYPVRIEIAREYLGITPEEYDLLFTQDIVTVPTGDQLLLWQLYGFESEIVRDTSWIETIVQVPEFLRRTGLTYCEFVELWKVQCVPFHRAGRDKTFPECEPCCLDEYVIQFANEDVVNDSLRQLAVFIRLWHKLQKVQEARYTFTQLYDICIVLGLFNNDGTINPDFIRQLAAFQMLRDNLELPLTDRTDHRANTTEAERTHLLALWVGTSASRWSWAVNQLLNHIQHYAHMRHGRGNRSPHFIKIITDNLDLLSRLAGFDPASTTDNWYAHPTHTLRFAEVLSKIYASDFSVGELLFLFTADAHLDGDDPFPLQDENETSDFPLALPDDQDEFSLLALRHKLLSVHISEEEAERWTWRRIEASLRHEFGYAPSGKPDPLYSLGEHFFPDILESCGHPVYVKQRQYRVNLTNTNAAMWNTPTEGPFRYDASAEPSQLWIQLPLKDAEVFERLSHIRQLNPDEQSAVQDLYFSPRADLAPFAFIFSNFGEAVDYLVQEEHERKRWAYFQREFALCHARCHIIAEHLAHHITAATSQECPEGTKLAWNVLQHLYADENMATPSWEVDNGSVPAVTWQQPGGGAFAALLGLTGTGLYGEFTPEGSANPIWREVRGPISAFGREKNRWNAPVPTILPALNLTLSQNQARFVAVRNGFALKDQNGESLGGAQGFSVRWQGTLLIEHEGKYEFWAGAPTPAGEKPDFEAAEPHKWRVTLKRGQKSWDVLSHRWSGAQASATHSGPLMLRRGAYQLTVEFTQPEPHFAPAEVHRQHTGFQLKYSGPDSEHRPVAIPYDRLYRDEKDTTLDDGLAIGEVATNFLKHHFTSTLRDMRRTYQRAFKAVLFAHRFDLSARPVEDYSQSEIGYMLAHPDLFEGTSYYRPDGGASFVSHHAYFDFNLLPLLDTYHAPLYGQDQRVQPLLKRQQALFDWWERIFDYVQVRRESRSAREHPLWLLFEEAAEKQPDDPAHLLRHMGIDLRHAALVTQYYDGIVVSSTDLEDERWAIRVWQAETWIRRLMSRFAVKDIQKARPDLWASDDPNIVESGEAESGNANLTHFVYDSCFEHRAPRRYKDVRRLNDGLRERARRALLAYLCGMNRVQMPLPQGGYAQEADDLSALLLLDVEVGLCEKASRVEDAISVVQTYVQRCRLGLEDGFTITPAFIRLWDRRFASFHIWQVSKRREMYRENWIDWEAIQQAQNSEAFRFLESELQRTMLTAPRPGGLEYWPEQRLPAHPELALIQRREPDLLQQFSMSSVSAEGFNLLSTQERDARPSWLATIQPPASGGGNPNPNPNPEQDNRNAEENGATTIVVESRQPGSLDNPGGTSQTLPLWIQAAIRLGLPFLRVAAAGEPPASVRFAPAQTESETCCCCECGKQHPAVVDEYYFWLLDSRYYDDFNNPLLKEDTPQPQDATWDWENPEMIPTLLHWDSKPMVQLAWSRVHNGEFQQPRRSVEGLPVDGSTALDLQLLGRCDDSLTFTVAGGLTPDGYTGGEQPGFRYDLATDETVTLPLDVLIPSAKPLPPGKTKYPGGFASYPFFAYFAPGTPIMPPSLFSPALAVAGALRAHCSFEAALKWYALAFNPLQEDCSWCVQDTSTGITEQPSRVAVGASVTPAGQQVGASNGNTPAKVVGEPVEQLAATTGDTAPAVAIVEPATPPVGALADSSPAGDEGESDAQTTAKLPDEVGTPAGREMLSVAEHTLIVQPAEGDGEGDGHGQGDAACCSSICVSDEVAQNRSIILHYLETLHQWADSLLRRNSPEAVQQARLILDTEASILGKRPRSVMGASTNTVYQKEPPLVINFQPACAPLNPRLLALYDLVDDRLAVIHECLDARRLKDGHRERDKSYWGNFELRDGWQSELDPCSDEEGGCCPASPYRFMFLLQKAQELASQVKELGTALLAAFEKGDAEYLASLRELHERQILELTLEIRRNQWREADWQVQALKLTQQGSQARRQYNALLIQNGLISGEVQHQALTDVTLSDQETGRILEGIGTILGIIPDVNVGTLDFATLPIGSKLQGVFSGMSQIVNSQGGSASTTGSLRLTQAGWDRREAEWRQQVQVLDIENDQIERQILAAERRRDIALRELNNHQQQMEHAAEVQDFLRDKFTSHALYLYLQQETANLHSRMYELARCTALQAQRAFNYERGHTMRRFLPDEAWDSLHEGLLAGERLQLSLRHMEKAYLDENVREYELTRHFSLRLHFPLEFLRLKATGCCEIDIPEWMFDQLYPGHYMRRVKNVSLTIPCVVGPYTGVHCRLTLLSSRTRVNSRLIPLPVSCCGDDDDCENSYSALPDDPRIITTYAATEAIATSGAQNDSGMFELNFRDERYLPFEFAGAVSRWRIELPQENNQFDMDTLNDVILHLNYTAREGGEALRHAANEVAQCHLPGDGWRFFDIRHEFPDSWHRFSRPFADKDAHRQLTLRLGRDAFPFIPGHKELWIHRSVLFFEAPDAEPGSHQVIEFLRKHSEHGDDNEHIQRDSDEYEVQLIDCIASDEWPGLYCGVVHMQQGPLSGKGEHELGTFRFPAHAGNVSRAFLLCEYEAAPKHSADLMKGEWHR